MSVVCSPALKTLQIETKSRARKHDGEGFLLLCVGMVTALSISFCCFSLYDIAYVCVICLSHTVNLGRNWVGVFI